MKPLNPTEVSLRGNHLIEASAGTGKTYAITTLYLRCLLERKLAVEDLLVVTYTRAATAELRDRIRQRIHECAMAMQSRKSDDATLQALVAKSQANATLADDRKRLALALRSFDQAGIFTIHSFCQRCLTDSAFESGASFDKSFESDDSALGEEIALDFWSREMYAIDPLAFVFLQDAAFTLDDVRALCRRAMADPDLVILPGLGDSRDPDLEPLHRAYAALRECWHAQRDAIVCALRDAKPSLHQGIYKPAQITSYAQQADDFLASAQARPISAKSQLPRLGASYMQSKVKKGKVAPSHAFFTMVDDYLAVCEELGQQFSKVALRLKLSLVDYARSQARQRKDQEEQLSFDDLLVQLRSALRAPSGEVLAQTIAKRFPIALIDEFQDTDPVQYEVFQRIYAAESGQDTALFLIGDPKQAIYSFRGADLFTYFNARDNASFAHTLGTNYRSSPGLIAAVNRLFAGAKDSFLFPELQFSGVTAAPGAQDLLVDGATQSCPFEMLLLERYDARPTGIGYARKQCTERVAGEIVRLLTSDATIEGRGVQPSDIAVLVRQNHQARVMQAALRRRGVPSVLESSESVFLSQEAAEIGRVLAAMAEPSNRNAIKSALSTNLLGYNGNAIVALQADETAWDAALVQFQRYHLIWVSRGFIQAFSQMLSEQKVGARLLRRSDGQRKMTNLGHLGELLQARALEGGAGPQALLGWLHRMRVDKDARALVGDAAQLRLESDDAAVKIVTVHKSKGLEYNIVYCPFVWMGGLQRLDDKKWVRFHDRSDDYTLKLDIGSNDKEAHLAQSAREALAEDLRLLYVALTRARHRCSIVLGVIKGYGSSGLAYLLLRDDALQTDAASLERFAAELEELDDAQLTTRLRKTFSGPGSPIGVRTLERHEGLQYAPSRQSGAGALHARPHSRALNRPWRSASFSSLSRGAGGEQDYDAHTSDAPAPLAFDDVPASPIVLANFPKGAQPGQMMHHVLEHLDFWQADTERIDQQVRASLGAFGFETERHAETLRRALSEVLRTRLSADGPRLADLPRAQRLDELAFQFPVCEQGSAFISAELAAALATRRDAPWPAHYLESITELGFAPLHGFLRGFIDLVFIHEERWYLVDYKSNFLGAYGSDYAGPAMQQSMAEHHYYLQYHLYLVALDRYLRLRLPGYDYQTHMGGVYYLYLRGMHPETAQTGVFFDRPEASALASLDAALRGSAEGHS